MKNAVLNAPSAPFSSESRVSPVHSCLSTPFLGPHIKHFRDALVSFQTAMDEYDLEDEVLDDAEPMETTHPRLKSTITTAGAMVRWTLVRCFHGLCHLCVKKLTNFLAP